MNETRNTYWEQQSRVRELAQRLAREVTFIAAEGKIRKGEQTEALCAMRFEYAIGNAFDYERSMARMDAFSEVEKANPARIESAGDQP